jgi:hypothetical protein
MKRSIVIICAAMLAAAAASAQTQPPAQSGPGNNAVIVRAKTILAPRSQGTTASPKDKLSRNSKALALAMSRS